MAEKFRSFYIDQVPRQKNAHVDALASLAASLSLPAGATKKVLVYNHDLYCSKFTFEESQTPRGDLQVEEVLETSTGPKLRDWRFLFIDFVLYDIFPDNPMEATAIRRKTPRFYHNVLREHYIANRMMEFYSNAFNTKRYRRTQGNSWWYGGAHQPGPKLRDRIRRLGYY